MEEALTTFICNLNLHHPKNLNLYALLNFRMGQDNKPRYGTFHQFAEVQAYSRAGQHDRLLAHIGKFRQLFIERRNQFLHGIRVDADVGAVLRTLYTARNAVFQSRVQRDAG